ncbi:hypothetical protein OPQ81_000348 [Rhizoctonia solani]|nr:hypothetical protein OPQ81_000348 [Rhizoctonia solani]
MPQGSRRPGPARTSCLTCRRRHKKCDLRQPTCERGAQGILNHSSTESSASWNLTASHRSTVVTGSAMSILQQIGGPCTRLPHSVPGPSKTCLDSQWLINTIIARVEKAMARWYLKPTNHQKEHFRQDTVQRLRYSKFARWIGLVGGSLIESFLTGDMSHSRIHNAWLEYIENSLKRELTLDLAPWEIRERRTNLVHVSLMKTMLIHSSNTYQLLRHITPVFLQVAYSTPALWLNDCDLTRIPLLNILTSGCHELAYFAFIDCTYAMISGLPQQVEYDTTIPPRPRRSRSYQWAPNSSLEMLLALADINACRDKFPSSQLRDWKDIEKWLLAWQSEPGDPVFSESQITIAWYAVQESWRLSLLTYLYLAVCDAPSDDPRIQSCVKQILQIVGMIKKPRASDINVSFFCQYLIVGICARSEAHRKIVWDKITSEDETRLWLMRAPDLAPVLDHLWRGAAADGHPVKWSDYVHSREAVLPIAL